MANRLITINLRKYLAKQPRVKRNNKAIALIRSQVARFAKVSPENVKLGQELNALVFKRYSRRPTPVKLNVAVDNGRATVTPFPEKAEKAPAPATAVERKKVEGKAVAAPKK